MLNVGNPIAGGTPSFIFFSAIRDRLYIRPGVFLRFLLFWDVTQRLLVVTDVSGQPIGLICKGHAVQKEEYT